MILRGVGWGGWQILSGPIIYFGTGLAGLFIFRYAKDRIFIFNDDKKFTKLKSKQKVWGVGGGGWGRDDDEHFHDSNIMLSFVAFMIISNILYILHNI